MHIINRSHLEIKNALPYFEIPELAKLGWVQHAFLTRKGGVSPPPYDSLNLSDKNGDPRELVIRNKALVAAAFGFNETHLILLDQKQQDQILLLKKPTVTLPALLEYDALITDCSNIILGILTADCLPIFVLDQKKRVIAAIHAGRQGTALRIVTKILKEMEKEFGSSLGDLLIAIGPSIGPCCYEIDERAFHPEWEALSIPKTGRRWMVDLAKINIAEMKRRGVEEEQIFWINLCTSCQSDLFFSYRREARTGRQLSFIGILE